jgi:hypothetical protein
LPLLLAAATGERNNCVAGRVFTREGIETMSSSDGPRPNEISKEIKRQIGQQANARYLRALPLFSVDKELPKSFHGLLHEIDHAESRRKVRHSKTS